VDASRSDPPTPGARAAGRAAQRRERERAARAKEQKIRRRERLEQYNEEYQLREQQGLSPPLAPVVSSSEEEEEESDGGRVAPKWWNPPPHHHRPRRWPWSWCLWRARRHPHWVIDGGAGGPDGCAARALEEEEARLLQPEEQHLHSTPLISRGWCLSFRFLVHRVTPIVPALAPTKALRSGTRVTTRRCSSRAPWAAASAAVMGEPSGDVAVAAGPQQEGAMAAATAATSQVLVPHAPSHGHG
jgi:hypothetical protein